MKMNLSNGFDGVAQGNILFGLFENLPLFHHKFDGLQGSDIDGWVFVNGNDIGQFAWFDFSDFVSNF